MTHMTTEQCNGRRRRRKVRLFHFTREEEKAMKRAMIEAMVFMETKYGLLSKGG